MTSYYDLTAYGRGVIDRRFHYELKNWKRVTWWHKLETDVHVSMLSYFKGFIKFRRAVLDGGDLVKCMQDWVGCYEPIDSYKFAEKRNVPQLGFCEAINGALKLLKEMQDEQLQEPHH